MRCLDSFNRKMILSGGSLRNENIKNSREMLAETFQDDASYRLGIYFWELGRLGKEAYEDKDTIDIRIFNRRYSAANGVVVKFQTMLDTPVSVGDVIYDSTSDEYLICTESFNINDIHWQGKFTLCNWILKWQNKNGDILEYPCYDTNATQYNSGEQSNRVFTIGSSQHLVILPYDENTVILKHPQRFFLDRDFEHPTSYMVTQNDSTSYNYGNKGIVRVTLLETQHNVETDRMDLGICDYIDNDAIAVDVDKTDKKFISKSVISHDTNVIKSGGGARSFKAAFFDDDGNEVVGVVPNWKIICDFSDALYVEERENQLFIEIDDDDYVDEDFKIVLSDLEGNYTSSLLVRVESLL